MREGEPLCIRWGLCVTCTPMRTVSPRTLMRGPAFGSGGRWSRDARLVCPELYLAGISGFRVAARNDERGRYILGYCAAKRQGHFLCRVAVSPPLSGREEASRPRSEGEDCLSAASSAAPRAAPASERDSPITAAALLGSFFSL